MRKNGDEIRISTKNTTLRAIGFVLALVVAVGAFSYGIASIGQKDPGYYEVEAPTDPELTRYASGFTLTCYFGGENDQIKKQMALAQEVYGEALLRAYKLLDPVNTYDGYVNLATLNASLGQSVQVSEELLSVLTDAWQRTQQGEGYSLFAGPLVREWESILTLGDAAVYDPLRNADSAARIRAVYERTVQPDAFSLTVEGSSVRLSVAQDVLAFLQENEYDGGVVNTGLLHDAYMISIVCAALEAQGFTDGYLVSDSGLTAALSAHSSGGSYCFYSSEEGKTVQSATAAVLPGSAVSMLRSFPLEEGEFMYYSVDDVRRSSISCLTDGTTSPLLQSCLTLRGDGDVVQAAYDSLVLMLQSEQSGLDAAVESLDGTSVVYAAWNETGLRANSADFIPAEGVQLTLTK